ncbi:MULTISPECIES: ABC transporter ATP-binding protein [Butyricimonas]|uniref:ABC transporter ATP-binding protein n=1 Tax=Butyricimonas TaxID=574697 RepID=UPI0007FB3DAA|nr:MULTISPECIES: ABC transporter ATP-binding protein [Butyricimonas]
MEEDVILKVNHLSHRYSAAWALRNVSFEVRKHDICGLLGPNGAGKSTVMNIICGILRQFDGEVSIAGIDIQKHPLEAKARIGFLPQNPPIYPDFTVEEYLRHAAEIRRMPDREIKKALDEVLERCGITHFRYRLLSNLSGGYKQRVGIAQAIIHKPDLVIFDEPTNGLDPTQVLEVRRLLREIAQDSTVLISTHILSEVQAVCNKIVMVNRGKTIFKGSTSDFDNYIVPDSIFLKILSEPDVREVNAIVGVTGAEALGNGAFRVRFSDDTEALENIAAAAAAKGWHLEEMRIERSSLDAVFSALTK